MFQVLLAVAVVSLAGTPLAIAQSTSTSQPKVDHFTTAELLDKARTLESSAGEKGAASVKLNEYPNHYTMIALRNKNGAAEVHDKFADIFVILRGDATLLSGGSVVDPKTVSPGEITGTQVKDGSQTPVHEGDVLHIPAGLPHQLLLAKGELVYFVVKVREQ